MLSEGNKMLNIKIQVNIKLQGDEIDKVGRDSFDLSEQCLFVDENYIGTFCFCCTVN